LLDEKDKVVLIDPGMSLRVPYTDPCNYGCVTDVSAGTCRRLMKAQGQGGKLMYAAPEVIGKKEVVDAFAIDLWSAGVVLFVMLVGLAPFKWAHPTDKRYAKICKGGLKDLMDTLDIPLSPEACDLLQGFFWADPRRRLTLAEVMEHPWVQGKQFVDISLKPSKSPRKFTFNHLHNKKAAETGPKSCENLKTSQFGSEFSGPRLVTPHY
jgi:serine/threonine protein kinase